MDVLARARAGDLVARLDIARAAAHWPGRAAVTTTENGAGGAIGDGGLGLGGCGLGTPQGARHCAA